MTRITIGSIVKVDPEQGARDTFFDGFDLVSNYEVLDIRDMYPDRGMHGCVRIARIRKALDESGEEHEVAVRHMTRV